MIPYHDYEGAEYEYPPHEEVELKPCPFCGGKAILYIDCGYYIAECEDCEAMSGEHETEEETIKAWNKRVSEVEK